MDSTFISTERRKVRTGTYNRASRVGNSFKVVEVKFGDRAVGVSGLKAWNKLHMEMRYIAGYALIQQNLDPN